MMAPIEAKSSPVALWAGAGLLVVALAGFGIWRFLSGGASGAGYAQVTASPWAEIVSVQNKEGKALNVKGSTPIELELPPGEYVIELKNDQAVGKVNVVVKTGEVSQVNYTFPEVNVNAIVDELVSKY